MEASISSHLIVVSVITMLKMHKQSRFFNSNVTEIKAKITQSVADFNGSLIFPENTEV